jgi:hypothetical protein
MFYPDSMGIRFGPIDPLQLIFNVINGLVDKKVISEKEADEIVKAALDPVLPSEEKERILKSLKGSKEENKNGK